MWNAFRFISLAGAGWALAWAVLPSTRAQANQPPDFSVQVSAETSASPAEIHLHWPQGPFSTGYRVARKDPGAVEWRGLAELPADATSFSDSAVETGAVYEYQIQRTTTRDYTALGYVSAGIEVPLIEDRGRVLLVVEESVAGPLARELEQYQDDLIGDGWTWSRHEVSKHAAPHDVRAVIQEAYSAAPDTTRAVFLVGHIPVPYSGNIYPDGHLNHQGAWPADVYYGDIDGVWTDETVDNATSEREINWNVPGDGKFDQDYPPSEVELAVGRLDFDNMTAFSNKDAPRSELDLLRQYFEKNHEFRHTRLTAQRRGLIADNFGDKGDDPVAGSAWRNFPAFFGAENIEEVGWDEFFPTTTQESYLWAYTSGGGTYYISHGVGASDDFAIQDVQVVFAMFLGSFFGDWNNESNFLRASLGSGSILTAVYAGFPHWNFRPMALGRAIATSVTLTQNDRQRGLYPPYNQGTGQVHISLMGDPALRMHPAPPPADLSAVSVSGGVELTWTPSPADGLQGYHVYRALSGTQVMTRVTGEQPIPATSFLDAPAPGDYRYMVRAIKLETSGAGSYFSPSQGVFAEASVASAPSLEPPLPPAELNAAPVSSTEIVLTWTDASENEMGFRIQRKVEGEEEFTLLTEVAADVVEHADKNLAPGTEHVYRVQAFNDAGDSEFTSEAAAVTAEETAAATLDEIQSTESGLEFRINGAPGQRIVVESSDNLLDWIPARTNTLRGFSWRFTEMESAGAARRFFRARTLLSGD